MKKIKDINPISALVILIAINLAIGFLIGNQYGQTWDEPSFYIYGERSYEAYTLGLAGKPLTPERHIFFLDLRYYGPFYTAMGWKIVNMTEPFMKGWGYMDIWHLINFVFFQIALISMFFLAKRFVRPWTAFFIVLFFNAQPLLFGHAFINPKDMPFLTFFLASVTVGLYMVDAVQIQDNPLKVDSSNSFPAFSLILAVLFGLYTFTYLGRDLIYSRIGQLITTMYHAPADSWMGQAFFLLSGTSSRLPVDNYIHKAAAAHLERLALYLLAILVVGRKLYLDYSANGRINLHVRVNTRFWTMLLLAGITLGLATSIRLLAPFAGLLVAGYAVSKIGRDSIPTLIIYGSIAGIVSVLAWPFLWDAPSIRFFEAIQVMRDFPYNAEVRFMGDNIAPSNLPWYYVTFLVCVQLTEPALILAVLGVASIFYRRESSILRETSVLLAWFAAPLGLQILLGSNVYDNFRQFLFVLPPLFILAGIGFERFSSALKTTTLKIALATLCLLPGIFGIIRLHPYQYIYYNSFIGGVSGAEGNFELDYWLTSYREAGEYVNEHALRDANILAWGSGYNGARADLDVYSFGSDEDIRGNSISFEYAVITTRFFSHLGVFPNAPVVYEVRKDGALLTVVKKLTK